MKKQAVLTVWLFCLVLLLFSVGFVLLPDSSFSKVENRALTTLPEFSWRSLASGEYTRSVNAYFADQLPLRDRLVGLKGIAEIALGKGENNGILLGKNGTLARSKLELLHADGSSSTRCDGCDLQAIQAACDGIQRANAHIQVPFGVLLAGRNIDAAPTRFAYPREASDALLTAVEQAMDPEISRIDTVALFRRYDEMGESLYYKTDHHWTTKGAYLAYCEVMRGFGREADIIPQARFTKTTVSKAFYGTLWSAAGMRWVLPDSVEVWTLGNEAELEVCADGKYLDGLYSARWLSQKDCYSVFLDGVHDVITVKHKSDQARPVLLLIKDSFANSLAPFLAQHYDLVLLNLSSAKNDFTDVAALSERYEADRVLLVYTLENLLTSPKLSRLR